MKNQLLLFNKWLDTDDGLRVVSRVKRHLDNFLPNIYGSHLLQLGIEEKQNWLSRSAIYHHYFCLPFKSILSTHVLSSPEIIPFATHSLDLVIIPFVLNYTHHPQALLRECDRVVRAGGHVMFINIHPLGFYGYLTSKTRLIPSACRANQFYRPNHLQQILLQSGFQTKVIQKFYHAPPFVKSKFGEEFFHQAGQLLPLPSNYYILIAVKKEKHLLLNRARVNSFSFATETPTKEYL